jgi:hypothetical protein
MPERANEPLFDSRPRYYGLNWGSRTPIAPAELPTDPDPLALVHEDADNGE